MKSINIPVREAKKLENKCNNIYALSGASAVYDHFKAIETIWAPCKECNAETPTISCMAFCICAVCGLDKELPESTNKATPNKQFTIDAILERWPDVLPEKNLYPKLESTKEECLTAYERVFGFPFLHRFSFLCNPSFNGSISGFTTYPVKYTTEEDTSEKTAYQCDSSEAQAWGIYANVHEKNEATGSEWIFDVENEKTAKELVSLLTLIGIHFTKQR